MALRKMDNPVINLKTSESSREKKEKILEFPDGFLWGTSTSAYQIEGNIRNDWSIWEKSYKRINNLQKNGKNITDSPRILILPWRSTIILFVSELSGRA